jgi:hypothetical protein
LEDVALAMDVFWLLVCMRNELDKRGGGPRKRRGLQVLL